MFFSIGRTQDSRFPNNHKICDLWFNCDNGWNQVAAGTWRKGYSENYCQVELGDFGARLDHNDFRSFPLWHNKNTITNLANTDMPCQVWADDQLSINQHGTVDAKKISLPLQVSDQTISLDQAQAQIKNVLDKTVTSFFDQHNTQPRVFLTGGVDTMLVYAVLKSHQTNMDLVREFIYEQDDFVQANQTVLNGYWAYCQLHHWLDPTWLATGSHGDEYLLRGPEVIALVTAWHDIDFEKILLQNSQCYHYKYFLKEKNLKIFRDYWAQRKELQRTYHTKEKLFYQVLNILVNDHQHWHLGNTLTWTPFRNIELTKILLQCDIQDLLPQFLDAKITKNLIDMYQPDLTKFLSDYKNFDNCQHLDGFFGQYSQG
jgi:hypothetical protein